MRTILSISLCALSIALSAQQIEDTITVEMINIQATRLPSRAPLTIQKIESSRIQELHYGQNPVLLMEQSSPSIFSATDSGSPFGNYTQLRMRGIAQERINFTFNGIPLNDMIDHGTFFSNLADINRSVESIQILRGVGTTANGTPSFGGAVSLEGMSPFSDVRTSELSMMHGSFNSWGLSARTVVQNESKDAGLLARFSHQRSDGYKDNSQSKSYSGYLTAGKKWKNNMVKFTALLGKTQNGQSYLPVLLDDIEEDPQTSYNHPNDEDDFEQELIIFEYTRKLDAGADLGVSAYHGGARGFFPFGLDDETQLVFGLENERQGLRFHLHDRWKEMDWTIGAHAYSFRRVNEEWVAPQSSSPYFRAESKKREVSAFAKANYRWNAFLFYGNAQLRTMEMDFISDQTLNTGVDHVRQATFLNGLIGAQWQLDSENQFYFSYGRTQREPTRADIFQGDEEEIQSDAIADESLSDWELGWRWQKDGNSLQLNAFRMNFRDEIVEVGALQSRTYFPVTQNVEESRRSGLELQSQWKMTEDLRFTLNGSWTDAVIDEIMDGSETLNDVRHVYTPEWMLSGGADFAILPHLTLRIFGRWWSDSFMELSNDSDFILPSALILDAGLDYALNEDLKLTVNFGNVLDQQYFTNGSPVDLDFDGEVEGPGYQIQAPRHFMVRIVWGL